MAILLVLAGATGCDRGTESQARPDPNRPSSDGDTSGLPLAPDVDPCQLPTSVISIHSGLSVERGQFTSIADGEGECAYAEADGDRVVIGVDTSGGAAHYDEVKNTTGGRADIDDVGDEAFWADPRLVVLSDGRYWFVEVQSAGTDESRRQTIAIALAQALEL